MQQSKPLPRPDRAFAPRPPVASPPAARAGRPSTYTSKAMLDRRRRILKETRRMIAENGIEGFSVRDLCKRAGVAQSTLYNAFQNKDRMIAIAIRETMNVFIERTKFSTDPLTLDGILDRAITSNRRNLQIKNYTRAVLAIYYSPLAHPDIWQAVQDLATAGRVAWLTALRKRGQVQPWIDIADYAHMDANLEYSTINDWCQGRLTDDAFLFRVTEGIVMHAAVALKGASRAHALALLTEMRGSGALPAFLQPRSA